MMTITQALTYLDSQAKEARKHAEKVKRSDQSFACIAVAIALEETAEVIRGDGKGEGEHECLKR